MGDVAFPNVDPPVSQFGFFRYPHEEGMTASATSLDQTKMGAAAVGVAIAQALSDSDPSLTQRAHQKAMALQRVMRLRGEDQAADILLYFSSALMDQSLTPPEAA